MVSLSGRLYLACALLFACWLLFVEAGYPGRRSDNGASSSIGGGCIRPSLDHGRVRGRQSSRLVRFLCWPGYELVGNKYATCASGGWDVPTPVCARPGCKALPNIEHGIRLSSHHGAYNVFFCGPGHQLTGSSVLFCDGAVWNSTLPVCVDTSKPSALTCDYETADWCGWRNDEYHDFDWRRYSKKTPSAFMNTGPSHDHTLGAGGAGHYLYVESTGKQENDQARLLSPIYSASVARSGCFSLYYHMFGKTTGKLRVYQKPITLDLARMLSARESRYLLLEKVGNQGDRWYRAVLPLQDFNEDFQIVLEGVRGSSFTSDIAVDDVAILLNRSECQLAVEAVETMTLPTTPSLDSCAGRCFSENPITIFGDTYECSCEESCLGDYSCCADYRDLCEMPEISSALNNEDWAVGTSVAPHELIPQTMKLVASSIAHAPETTSQHTTVATTTTTAKPTVRPMTAATPPSTPTTPAWKTTLRTTSTTLTTTFSTTVRTAPAKTATMKPSTIKPTTHIIEIVATKRLITTSPLPQTKNIPKLFFKSTTREPYNATGVLGRNATVLKPPRVAVNVTAAVARRATTTAWTHDDNVQPISRTFENHNTYHKLVKEQREKQANAQKGAEGSSRAAWVWVGAVAAVAGVVALLGAAGAVRRAARRREGRCAEEVRYLTHDDHLDFDAPEL